MFKVGDKVRVVEQGGIICSKAIIAEVRGDCYVLSIYGKKFSRITNKEYLVHKDYLELIEEK